MKIIALMLITITIPLTSFPASIARGGGGGGPGYVGNSGAVGKGTGTGNRPVSSGTGLNARPINKLSPPPGTGYRGGGDGYRTVNWPGKPQGGGDPGASIVVIPKPIPKDLPKECKEEVLDCITNHIYQGGAEPKHRGSCCVKLKNSVPCVCKFLTSKDPESKKAANGVLRGCHYRKPICINMPMPQECRQEVRHCINTHVYGTAGQPIYRGACCMKFKNSKSCVTKFLVSPDPKLNEAANSILRGCHFRKPRYLTT